jgi:hypothetical protein
VAYERAGRYDVHTARWGRLDGRLWGAITPADPYGDGAVDPQPRVRDRSFEAVLTMVDPARHEAVYRVRADGAVEGFLVAWVGLDHYLGRPPAVEARPLGLLVGVDGPSEAADLRAWLRAAKAALAEGVAAGHLDRAAATTTLVAALRERADGEVHRVGDPDEY